MVRKTNFLSFSVLISKIVTFLTKKRSSLWISQKMLQNNRMEKFRSMWLSLETKTIFFNICPLFLVWSKTVVLTNPNFSQGFPLSKMVKKPQLSVYFSARFWESLFWLRREVLSEFPPKFFKITERHSLVVSVSLWGEKHFWLTFVLFYWFDKKKLF